jgi:hypothetical protein
VNALALAALASIPAREGYLARVLESLRPQVQRLCVYLNGYAAVPACVHAMADRYVLDPKNAGAERKFWWADTHGGLYFSCDDDIVYPKDYVEVLSAAIAEHGPRVIVTAHGRSYLGRPRSVHEVAPGSLGLFHKRVDCGRPINHGGTGVMAWDARAVRMPTRWPMQNIADMQVAVWAQQNRMRMQLVPHQANWFKPLALIDPNGIFRSSQSEEHKTRAALLMEQGRRQNWAVW